MHMEELRPKLVPLISWKTTRAAKQIKLRSEYCYDLLEELTSYLRLWRYGVYVVCVSEALEPDFIHHWFKALEKTLAIAREAIDSVPACLRRDDASNSIRKTITILGHLRRHRETKRRRTGQYENELLRAIETALGEIGAMQLFTEDVRKTAKLAGTALRTLVRNMVGFQSNELRKKVQKYEIRQVMSD